jgi:hypothetical protein
LAKLCVSYAREASQGTQTGETPGHHIREGKSPDDKKTAHFVLNFLQISTIFASFSWAHAGTLQNHSISPCTTTVRNNTVESSTIFHSNLMLHINWFYEI